MIGNTRTTTPHTHHLQHNRQRQQDTNDGTHGQCHRQNKGTDRHSALLVLYRARQSPTATQGHTSTEPGTHEPHCTHTLHHTRRPTHTHTHPDNTQASQGTQRHSLPNVLCRASQPPGSNTRAYGHKTRNTRATQYTSCNTRGSQYTPTTTQHTSPSTYEPIRHGAATYREISPPSLPHLPSHKHSGKRSTHNRTKRAHRSACPPGQARRLIKAGFSSCARRIIFENTFGNILQKGFQASFLVTIIFGNNSLGVQQLSWDVLWPENATPTRVRQLDPGNLVV